MRDAYIAIGLIFAMWAGTAAAFEIEEETVFAGTGNAEVSILSKTLPRVSEVLNRHAVDHSSDLIVMGAYGHSRFREALIGGATRDMLETAQVPVMMAH